MQASDNPRLNKEGYPDPTAYEGIRLASDEVEPDWVQRRASWLIAALKRTIRQNDFELIARIELRDRRTGREFR